MVDALRHLLERGEGHIAARIVCHEGVFCGGEFTPDCNGHRLAYCGGFRKVVFGNQVIAVFYSFPRFAEQVLGVAGAVGALQRERP